MFDAIDIYHELLPDLREGAQHVLDLGRKDVDPPDDQHIVAPAGDPFDLLSAPAGASILHQPGHVAGAVADERQGLLDERVMTSSPPRSPGARRSPVFGSMISAR